MTHLRGEHRSQYVVNMFGRISKTYDLLNRLMTFGQDHKWRTEAVAELELESHAVVLDLGAGTGDITFEVLDQFPDAVVIGLDLTPEMLHQAISRGMDEKAYFVIADVHDLPFPANTFSATIFGFLMRNLPNHDPVLLEQHRVLCGEGKLVCLETSPVKDGILKLAICFYIQRVIPLIGRIISKDPEAYSYFAISTKQFLSPEEFSQKIHRCGFTKVGFIQRMLGTVAIHSACKG